MPTRLPSGRGWRLRASGAGHGLAESIYLGEEGRVRRTEQIVLVGQAPIEGSTVKWALTRMEVVQAASPSHPCPGALPRTS